MGQTAVASRSNGWETMGKRGNACRSHAPHTAPRSRGKRHARRAGTPDEVGELARESKRRTFARLFALLTPRLHQVCEKSCTFAPEYSTQIRICYGKRTKEQHSQHPQRGERGEKTQPHMGSRRKVSAGIYIRSPRNVRLTHAILVWYSLNHDFRHF